MQLNPNAKIHRKCLKLFFETLPERLMADKDKNWKTLKIVKQIALRVWGDISPPQSHLLLSVLTTVWITCLFDEYVACIFQKWRQSCLVTRQCWAFQAAYRCERRRAVQMRDEMMPPPRCKKKAEDLGYSMMDWKDYFARDEPFWDTD